MRAATIHRLLAAAVNIKRGPELKAHKINIIPNIAPSEPLGIPLMFRVLHLPKFL